MDAGMSIPEGVLHVMEATSAALNHLLKDGASPGTAKCRSEARKARKTTAAVDTGLRFGEQEPVAPHALRHRAGPCLQRPAAFVRRASGL